MTISGKLAFLSVILFFGVSAAFSNGWKDVASEQYLFSVSYPSDWHFDETDEGFEIFSQKDFSGSKEGGAGVFIAVYPLELEDKNNPVLVMKRIEDDLGGEINFDIQSEMMISGEKWVMFPFVDNEAVSGKVLCAIMGLNAYFMAFGYSGKGSMQKYEPDIKKIMETFTFSVPVYKKYSDKEKGISFEYPSHWTVNNKSRSINIESRKDVDNTTMGIAIEVGAMDIPEDADDNFDEYAVYDAMLENDEIAEISGPDEIQLKDMKWIHGEIAGDTFTGYYYLSKHGSSIYIIAMLVNPSTLDEAVHPELQHFLDTLVIEFE